MTEATAPKQPKNCISYRKIATFRSRMRDTESGGKRSNVSHTLFAFEKEDGISFVCRSRSMDYQQGERFADAFRYKLKMRTTKSGEKRFVFYKVTPNDRVLGAHGKTVATANPNDMRSKFISFVIAQEKRKKRSSLLNAPAFLIPDLYVAQQKRLLAFIRAFLRKHKIKFSHLSKNPCSLILQLCYPGTVGFDEGTLRKLSTGEFFLGDPVKTVLRTKGKKSRRLLCEAVKKHPAGANTLLRLAKYLRINRSLDKAQEFLEIAANSRQVVHDFRHDQYTLYKLKAKELSFLAPLSEHDIAEAVATNHSYVCDVLRMIGQVQANPAQPNQQGGFDITAIRYRTLNQLHDQLVAMLPGQRRGGRWQGGGYAFQHYEFDTDSAPMRFCALLSERFASDRYKVVYPRSSRELQEFGAKMHNCSFAYANEIRQSRYVIFCFASAQTDRPEYMFGYAVKKVEARYGLNYNQAVGMCNARIESAELDELKQKISELMNKGDFYFAPEPTVY